MHPIFTHPVLSCAKAAVLEKSLLGDDEGKIRAAMTRAGEGVADAALRDWLEIAPLPEPFRILVLCGTGHNAGDALLAARRILQRLPHCTAEAILVYGRTKLRPLTLQALEELEATGGPERVRVAEWNPDLAVHLADKSFDLCIEGVVGMQMRPPMRPPAPTVFGIVNRMEIALRAAVDLPAGIGDGCAEEGFTADFTYATGIAKAPVLEPKNRSRTGRVRYVDIGFFDNEQRGGESGEEPEREILLPSVLNPLRALRPADADKRSFGHLYLLGGSRGMPGAIGMATLASLRAGVGLATAFVSPDVIPALAPLAPEAMWEPLPVDDTGALHLTGCLRRLQAANRATAFVIGPGLDTSFPALRDMLCRFVSGTKLPLILDAGALFPELIPALAARPKDAAPVVLTPHSGEFARLAGPDVLKPDCDIEERMHRFASENRCILLLKGPITRICDGQRMICDPFGGPVLSRGGSGDLLAGIIGALAARPGANLLESVCAGAAWHGLAAERTARECGQQAVRTTRILDSLAPVLRER